MRRLIEELESRQLLSTYYVATTGNDNNPGTQSQPMLTIQNAVNNVQAGDTIDVEPGTYGGFILSWNNPQAGTAGSPITIQADPSQAVGSVIINSRDNKTPAGIDLEPGSDYVTISGFTVIDGDGTITNDGIKATGNNDSIIHDTVTGVGGFGIFTDNANNAAVEYDNISGTVGSDTTGHGIYISGTCTGVLVEYNIIDGNDYHGIHLNGDASEGGIGEVIDATIANNLIYNNPGNGINGDGVVDSLIENNVIYGFTNNGISLYQIDAGIGSTGNVIVNNTIDAAGAEHAIELQDGATGNVLFNNILLGSIFVDGTSSELTSNNVTSGSDSSLFVNSSGGNYQLASGSAAIGAGVASFDSLNAPTLDLLGDGRVSGRYDAGAYEFDSTPAQTPPAPGNLAVSQGTTTGGVTITWSAAQYATSYQVFRSTTNDSSTALKIAGGMIGTGYVDTTATPGQTYFYWVKARNMGLIGAFSTPASGFELGSPANLAASSGVSGSVNVSWNSVTSAASYQVFRSTVNDVTTATKIGFGIVGTSFQDQTASPGQSYFYWVRARNPENIGVFGAPVIGWSALLVPTGVSASDGPEAGEVTVQWTSILGAAGYQVFRSTTDNINTAVKVGIGIAGDSWIDDSVQSGVTYYYWVRARNPLLIGGYSAVASVTA